MKKKISNIYNLYTAQREIPKEFKAREVKTLEDAKVAALYRFWV